MAFIGEILLLLPWSYDKISALCYFLFLPFMWIHLHYSIFLLLYVVFSSILTSSCHFVLYEYIVSSFFYFLFFCIWVLSSVFVQIKFAYGEPFVAVAAPLGGFVGCCCCCWRHYPAAHCCLLLSNDFKYRWFSSVSRLLSLKSVVYQLLNIDAVADAAAAAACLFISCFWE